ncbi:unannotated protein [freshwater metagenome]|uniref:Unannotated protein n=1 Tax=freshwater metagenome TaxID=449393 RepID=A0A6J6ENZ0_9ZZZZ
MAPPTVTNRVPGVTGTNQPRGTLNRKIASRLTLDATSMIPVSGEKVMSAPSWSDSEAISMTVPPAFCAAAP